MIEIHGIDTDEAGGAPITTRKLTWPPSSAPGVKNTTPVTSATINWKITPLPPAARKNSPWCAGNAGRAVDELCPVRYWHLFKLPAPLQSRL